MIKQAFRFPFGDDRGAAAEVLLVGGGLHLLSVFVPLVPLVPVVGYLVRVLGDAGDASDPGRLPSFRAPLRLLRDGLVASLLVVAFLLVPVVVLLVTFVGALQGNAGGAGVDPTTPLGYGVTLVGGTVTLLLAIAAVYPLPAVLSAYARSEADAGTVARVKAALSLGRLRRTVSTGRYFYGWVIGAVLLLIGLSMAGAGSRPLRVIGFFSLFYLEVAAAASWSRGIGGNG
ncbi:DUF4013 domain-containing protein [Halobaculum limi]|uniref:DUF4013 domain-containing protein n=1 Tax=Halobaculum limi TaxID=3031916 RepID=UPI0024070258|nr:DUF4013 domain-containing protein [Halobaculum sp. YSMS11]